MNRLRQKNKEKRLPGHISKTRGHLFTDERPTLACNQRILCDQIDTMLAEINGVSNAASNVNIGSIPSRKPGFAGASYPVQRGLRGFRGQGRAPSGPRQIRPPALPATCQHCLEARRYDASTTHPSNRCNWMAQKQKIQQRPQQYRQQVPGYKVLLVPNTPAPAGQYQQGVDQPSLVNQLQSMSMDVQSQVYGDTFQYPDNTGYEQYEYQHDDQTGGVDYTSAAGYVPGSLEEL